MEELREFRDFLRPRTTVAELQALNTLGAQFALRETSKYFFYLRYESGQRHKPSTRGISLMLQVTLEADAPRLR